MKTKSTYYYFPTFIRYEGDITIETLPGPQGFIECRHERYMVAFLGNIWPLKDRDINPWILPAIGAATVFFGILYFIG
jgi:hypothetical protein